MKDEELDPLSGASPEAIRYHYDVGNDFFSLWLDKSMTYSAAMWSPDIRSLEDAQTRKRAYHIQAARAAGKCRVLDIGCGWGSCLFDLVERYGVDSAVGLTLSSAQLEWINQHKQPKVDARLEGWQEHEPTAPYDAIISVGALEHFVRPDYDLNVRKETYRSFFEKCHGLLSANGWMSLQFQAYLMGQYSNHSPLSAVFPESDMPRLSEIIEATERLFEPEVVRNEPNDYLKTLDAWLANFRANEEAIIEASNSDLYRRYLRFLTGGVRGYSSDIFMLLRISLRRI